MRNSGPEPVKVVVSINGAPVAPEPAIARGFELERRYYTLDGKPADPSKATQNQRFAVVLKVNETESALAEPPGADVVAPPPPPPPGPAQAARAPTAALAPASLSSPRRVNAKFGSMAISFFKMVVRTRRPEC